MSDEARLDDRRHLSRLFFRDLKLCGCGNPEDAYELVRKVLDLAPLYEHPQKARDLVGDSGAYHIVLSVLDSAGLMEHGGGIGGAWLTDKGTHYRELMHRYEYDDIEEIGLPHDGAPGCPADCRHRESWSR